MRFLSLVVICVFMAACSDKGTDAEVFDAAKVCPESKRGTFVDERDGRVYKYTTIGDQVWMAQNLNYEGDSYDVVCKYPETDCEKEGRIYTWRSANEVCPDGWHLPSKQEWIILVNNMGGEEIAGHRLKTSQGWIPINDGETEAHEDECDFSAYPTLNNVGSLDGYASAMWAINENGGTPVQVVIQSGWDAIKILDTFDYGNNPIRCVKN